MQWVVHEETIGGTDMATQIVMEQTDGQHSLILYEVGLSDGSKVYDLGIADASDGESVRLHAPDYKTGVVMYGVAVALFKMKEERT